MLRRRSYEVVIIGDFSIRLNWKVMCSSSTLFGESNTTSTLPYFGSIRRSTKKACLGRMKGFWQASNRIG